MKLPLSWLRDFVEAPADTALIASKLGSCGFAIDGIDGDVLDVDVTANRPDCLNVTGLAREVATALSLELKSPDFSFPELPDSNVRVPVAIDDAACGRYAMVVADVTMGPSPAWLSDRLTAAGVRPISNVVDVTNYVMLEIGQPMHAFDLARLAGPAIHVRAARVGEQLTTLDGQTRKLDPSMLVIADASRAVALAGVMGGATSEVSGGTTRIALESAWFAPASVRLTARKVGLKTEASARFERGADIESPVNGLARALALLAKIGAVRAAGPIVDVRPTPLTARVLTLRRAALDRLLGDRVPDADVQRILTRLGFLAAGEGGDWRVTVPSWRVDVLREADLIEEVGRHWGFDRVPATFPALRIMPRETSRAVNDGRRLSRILSGAGLNEACTFTFIERAAAEPFVRDAGELAAIANPLSEKFAVLRPSLLPGLLDSIIYNRRREQADVRLFEVGSAFTPGERKQAGWLCTGRWADHWSGSSHATDFFDADGIAELIGAAFGVTIRAEATRDLPWLVPGRAARLFVGSTDAGYAGQIQPAMAAARGLGQAEAIYGGILHLDALGHVDMTTPARVEALPRYPSIVRDLSFFIDERLPAADLRGTIHAHAPATLVQVREFDRYTGKGVPDGQISLSVRLTFRSPDRTLTDADVQQAVDVIVAALSAEHGATLRGAPNA